MGDPCPSNKPLQEDLPALSKANELLHRWKAGAEVALGTELSSDVSQSHAEP